MINILYLIDNQLLTKIKQKRVTPTLDKYCKRANSKERPQESTKTRSIPQRLPQSRTKSRSRKGDRLRP